MDELGRHRLDFKLTWFEGLIKFFWDIKSLYMIGFAMGSILIIGLMGCILYYFGKKFYCTDTRVYANRSIDEKPLAKKICCLV
jgi:hypothetical protein